MELLDWFQKGMDYDEYVQQMTRNKENMLSIGERFTLNEELKKKAESLKHLHLRAIALTEDWCGDAMINNPIFMHIAETGGIEVRFLLRDQNLELMDQYLTNGKSRSIPKYIFIDQEGKEYAVWGPRAPEVQAYVETERAKLPDANEPEFQEKQKEMYRSLTKRFLEDQNWWNHIAEDILNALHK